MPAHTTARGYGYQHQKERQRWTPLVEAGGVICARCDTPIRPGQPWDLGHVTGSQTLYSGPEHRRCNRRTNSIRVETHDPSPQPRTRW